LDRFNNGDEIPKTAVLVVEEFTVEARVVEGERRYAVEFRDPEADASVQVILPSHGMAQLEVALARAAITACDDAWLTMLMVLLTESPQESVDRLFESGHAKGNLPD